MTADMSAMPVDMRSARRCRARRLTQVLALAALGLVAGAPVAHAANARYEGSSTDGKIVFFTTSDKLVSGDSDSSQDVFERSKDASAEGEYVTREVSIGPTGGNDARDAQYAGASTDGSRVFFSTRESLVPEDDDKSVDVYMRDLDANTTTLVSQGDPSCASAGCGNGEVNSSIVSGGVVPDGERAFFATTEKLNADDDDSAVDIYVRDIAAETTTRVSQGGASCASSGCGNGDLPAIFREASESGDKAFFTTSEALVSADTDEELSDVYERDLTTGTTSLVSTPGTCPSGADCNAVYGGASSDGSHVFFETREQVSGSDTDVASDVYDWSGGVATLASTGPDGGNGNDNVTYAGSSADGSSVFFETSEALDTAVDTDSLQDVYRRRAGTTTLVSTGPEDAGSNDASFAWSSEDGSIVIFGTAEPLVAADGDASQDVYKREAGTTTLLSTAGEDGGEYDAAFTGASSDGAKVFFVTPEPLLAADEDESQDIYEQSSEGTSLVSTGVLNGNGENSSDPRGISNDGSYSFFTTAERLTENDLDAEEEDVYQHTASGTLLVSTGNLKSLGPAPPSALTTTPASPGESLTPAIHGQSEEGAAIKIYTTSDCSGEQAKAPDGEPAGGTAEQLADGEQGIEVKVAPGSETTFYATAEVEGIVSACSKGVTYRQQDAPPPPPPPPPPGEEGGQGSGGNGGKGGKGGSKKGGGGSGNGGITYVTPESRITFGPSFKTRKRRPVFQFVDATGQPGSRFICKVDRHRWRSCGSPIKLHRLKPGRHVFKVKAENAVGTWEARPSKRRFKVVRRNRRHFKVARR
jgi:hypothetical protein